MASSNMDKNNAQMIVNINLDGKNYEIWKYSRMNIFIGWNLWEIINGNEKELENPND